MLFKITVYVPVEDAENVKTAMFNAGAGQYRNYSNCSWETLGTGQFLPLKGSTPARGIVGQISRVPELRIEMLCAREYIHAVLQSLTLVHPYEEPAYDITKIELL